MTINVETSSLREIFDYVKNHLLTQNKQAKKLKPGYEMTINVETSSLREIFDYVKNHLLTQNKQAKN